jgi:integrase
MAGRPTSASGRPTGKPQREHINAEPLIRSWERHLQAEGKAPATVSNYGTGVRQFVDWLALGDREILEADLREIEEWLVLLRGRWRPATVWTRYMAVRLFFDWLALEEEIEESPFGRHGARRLRPPAIPESPKDVVDPETLRRLFRLLDRHKRWRDAVVIATLYDTGMRASELADALAANVDLDAGTILVERSKGRRPRLVGISSVTARYIDRYWRRPRPAPAYVVNGQKGKMTRSGIYQIVSACFQEVEAPGIGAHDLRHTSATHQVLSGEVSESGLMATFGWRTADMARHYTEQGRVRAALDEHRKASPMARLMERGRP